MALNLPPLKSRCVFCNKTLNAINNREHGLSKWLHKYTGEPDRLAKFSFPGLIIKTQIIKDITWDDFHIPACWQCNKDYSHLDDDASVVVKKIDSYRQFRSADVSLLFDWLDKVRVGTWWTVLQVTNNIFNVRGTFGIAERISAKDRYLRISVLPDETKGLQILGIGSYGFQMGPSVFALRVNNLLFLSASTDFLLATRMGCPFPTEMKWFDETGQIEATYEVYEGEPPKVDLPDEVKLPYTRHLVGMEFYQSISKLLVSPIMTPGDGNRLVPFERGPIAKTTAKRPLSDILHLAELELMDLQSGIVEDSCVMMPEMRDVRTFRALAENGLKTTSLKKKLGFPPFST